MSSPDIPTNYTTTMHHNMNATFLNEMQTRVRGDMNSPVASHMAGGLTVTMVGDQNGPIEAKMTGDPDKPIATQMTGDPDKPIATTVDLKNIPHLTLEDIKDIMTPKIRMHMPNYEQLSFKLFGMEVFSLCLSGEMQMITHPYVPNAYEQCKIECPDLDMRPFPEQTVGKMDSVGKAARSKGDV